MSNFTELEYKYNASEVKLEDFLKLMQELQPIKRVDASSWDIYYTKPKNSEWFIRYRKGESPELTKKRKVVETNNWERVEVDLPLDRDRINDTIVDKFLKLDGYDENFSIYKNCFIYWVNDVNFVYYTVYDKNMHEKGRFIEVEVNKDRVKELEDPTTTLKEYEQKLTILGITPHNRLKKSLFEMFYKEQ